MRSREEREHDRNNGRQNHHYDTVATNHHYERVNDSQEDNTTSNISKFDEMVASLYSFIVLWIKINAFLFVCLFVLIFKP